MLIMFMEHWESMYLSCHWETRLKFSKILQTLREMERPGEAGSRRGSTPQDKPPASRSQECSCNTFWRDIRRSRVKKKQCRGTLARPGWPWEGEETWSWASYLSMLQLLHICRQRFKFPTTLTARLYVKTLRARTTSFYHSNSLPSCSFSR